MLPSRTLQPFRFTTPVLLLAIVTFAGEFSSLAVAADAMDYKAADPDLTVIKLDSSPNESFLSMRTDTTGRYLSAVASALRVRRR
jgi:hypothetical protein